MTYAVFRLGLDYDRIKYEMGSHQLIKLQSLIIIRLQLLQTTPFWLFEVITVRDRTKWRTRGG